MINGERVRQAREIRGLTQSELADRVGVNQSNITRLERNAFEPIEGLMDAISLSTHFPPAFFRQQSGPEFPLGSLLYRKRSTLKSRDKAHLHQLARLGFELAETMAVQFSSIQMALPKLSEKPATAACVTRTALGLSPDTPITHLVNRLERNGVFILALPCRVDEHDAFSLWAESDRRKPVIIVSSRKPGDRQRFSVSHELGHLVLHHSFCGGIAKIEREAHEFASEFLLPEESMRREICLPVTLTGLAELKKRWGVSIQALVMRAQKLGIITDRQRKYLFLQITARGWRKQEPVNIPAEKPRLLRKMAEELYGIPIDYKKLALAVGAPVKLVREIMEVHEGKAGQKEQIKRVHPGHITHFPAEHSQNRA